MHFVIFLPIKCQFSALEIFMKVTLASVFQAKELNYTKGLVSLPRCYFSVLTRPWLKFCQCEGCTYDESSIEDIPKPRITTWEESTAFAFRLSQGIPVLALSQKVTSSAFLQCPFYGKHIITTVADNLNFIQPASLRSKVLCQALKH